MKTKKRIIITGGSGLLAINWACAVREQWDVILGTHHHNVFLDGVQSVTLNLDVPLILAQQIEKLSPDLIVHTAGLTSVDMCEKKPDLAEHVNAEIARNVAQVAAEKGVPLVHISTDHLFSGENSYSTEDAVIDPVNEYGRTKALAEKWVLLENADALIIRTNFFCWGHQYRQSFTDWLIYNFRAGKKLNLFDDVFFSPILADRLVLCLHELVEKKATGVYNLTGDERISKYDFAVAVCKEFSLSADLINRDRLTGAKLQANRPLDMSLNNEKIKSTLGQEIGTIAQFLSILHKQEEQGRKMELFEAVK